MTGLLKLAAVLALTVSASAAYGADLGGSIKDTPAAYTPDNVGVNWSGVYLGLHGGYGNANHELSVDESFEGKSFNIIDLDGINSRGFVGGIDGGFDVASSGGWVWGLLGGYSFSNMESSLSVFDGEGKLTLSKQGEWYLGGRLGRVVAPRTMWYLLAAYTQTEYELGGLGGDKPSQSYSGIKAGTGIEYALGAQTFAGLQYDHDFYGEQDWLNERGIKVSDKLNEDKIQATLKIKFGGGLPYLGD